MASKILAVMLIVAAYSVLFGSNLLDSADILHYEAAECRREFVNTPMSIECRSVCTECHGSTWPIFKFDIYDSGDTYICIRCHESKVSISSNNLLLKSVRNAGGNHRVQIFYSGNNGTKLKKDPQGAKLFFDGNGGFPKVHCSSCHDPMNDDPQLLRVDNKGSNLCFACHDM